MAASSDLPFELVTEIVNDLVNLSEFYLRFIRWGSMTRTGPQDVAWRKHLCKLRCVSRNLSTLMTPKLFSILRLTLIPVGVVLNQDQEQNKYGSLVALQSVRIGR